MLQSLCKARIFLSWSAFALTMSIVGCKSEPTITSVEESIYLADYETPRDKWGFIDTNGTIMIEAQFDEVGPFSEGLAAVNIAGKWGFINSEGRLVIPPQYRSAWAFHEQMARVKPFDKTEHFINPAGEEISSGDWTAADDFSEGLARISVGNSFGYVNTSGKIVLPAIYSRGWNFHHGVAVIAYEDKLGLIDTQGKEIIKPSFDHINYCWNEKLLICTMPDSSIVFNTKGEKLVTLEGVKVLDSDGRQISIRKDGLMFLYDMVDKKIQPGAGWRNILYLGEDRWAGKNETGFILLDGEGKKVNFKSYQQINRFNNGIAAVYTGAYWSYVDRYGIETSPDVFDLAWDYRNGFARAAFPQGIAFLNMRQQIAFYPPPGTIDMRDFSEGFAPVQISK